MSMYEIKDRALLEFSPLVLDNSLDELEEYLKQDLSFEATVKRCREKIKRNDILDGLIKNIILELIPLVVKTFYRRGIPVFIFERNLDKCIFNIRTLNKLSDAKYTRHDGSKVTRCGELSLDNGDIYQITYNKNMEELLKKDAPIKYERLRHSVPLKFHHHGTRLGLLPYYILHELFHLATTYQIKENFYVTGILFYFGNVKEGRSYEEEQKRAAELAEHNFSYLAQQISDYDFFSNCNEAITEELTAEAFESISTSRIKAPNLKYPWHIIEGEKRTNYDVLQELKISRKILMNAYLTLDPIAICDSMNSHTEHAFVLREKSNIKRRK